MIVVGRGSQLYGSPLSMGLLGLFVPLGSRMSRVRLAIVFIGVILDCCEEGSSKSRIAMSDHFQQDELSRRATGVQRIPS